MSAPPSQLGKHDWRRCRKQCTSTCGHRTHLAPPLRVLSLVCLDSVYHRLAFAVKSPGLLLCRVDVSARPAIGPPCTSVHRRGCEGARWSAARRARQSGRRSASDSTGYTRVGSDEIDEGVGTTLGWQQNVISVGRVHHPARQLEKLSSGGVLPHAVREPRVCHTKSAVFWVIKVLSDLCGHLRNGIRVAMGIEARHRVPMSMRCACNPGCGTRDTLGVDAATPIAQGSMAEAPNHGEKKKEGKKEKRRHAAQRQQEK